MLKIDLKGKINVPGQYILTVIPGSGEPVEIKNAVLYYDGNKALKEFVNIKESKIHINRTAQVTEDSEIIVELKINLKKQVPGKVEFIPEFIH
jgi:alpha-L-fucosidase